MTGHNLQIHPKIDGTQKRPDFRATDTSTRTAILECKVVTETPEDEAAEESRFADILDAIETKVETPDFFLMVDRKGVIRQPIDCGRLCRKITDWLGGLNYAWKGLPVFEYRDKKNPRFFLEIKPHHKRPSDRGKSGVRTIIALPIVAGFVVSHTDICKAIRRKAGRYGQVSLPFVIIVNCIGQMADIEEIQEAIYGSEGLWPSGRKEHTRVSAVLACLHLFPWSIAKADVRLYHNPHAAHPYDGPLTMLPQAWLRNGQTEMADGKHPREIFGLSESWPSDG